MEAVELEQIGTSIRSAMGETAGQFRQAAAKSNEDIGKVVKDISRMFKAQREELNEIGNTLQDSIHQSESESAKIDRLAGIFEESVQIQNDMLTEMRKSSAGMKYIGDNIVQLNQNMMGSTGLLGSLSSLNTSVGSIGTSVAAALLGAGIGAAGGAMLAGGAGGAGADAHTPVKTSGSFAQHQQEAYTAARSELSDSGAKILVANLSGESLKDPGDVHPDPSRSNPSQKAHGIASWSDVRSEKIKNQFGKYPQQMSVEEQTKALMWEMKKDYPKAWEALKNENLSDRDRLWAVVKHFENPAHPEADTEKRMGYLAGLKVSGAGESQTPIADAVGSTVDAIKDKTSAWMKDEGRGTLTPLADQPTQAEPVSSESGPRVGSMAKEHGHGPISGTAAHGIDTSKVKLIERYGPGRPERPEESILNIAKKAAAATGMESITATSGKGDYISPAGRAKGQKTTMHSTGLAVDLAGFTDDKQKLEFIKNAKAAGAKGVGVYDNGSVHIDLGRERSWNWGMKDDAGFKAALGAGTASAPQGDAVANMGPEMRNIGPPMPASMQQTAPTEQAQATPVTQEPAVTGPAAMGGMNPMAMMGMMGGMMPGGMGGIIGMLAPMLSSVLGSIQMPEAAATLESAPSTNVPAEMIQALSRSADNTQLLSQAAINKQAQQETAQDPITEALNSIFGQQQNTPDVASAAPLRGSYDGYNGPSDIGWPDWAEMIGGNHWKEMKNYKKNMWG